MLVYRVEHIETGEGPYHYCCDDLQDMITDHNDSKYHEPINLDVIHSEAWRHSNKRCGFEKLEQCYTWFGDWLRVMYDNEFAIAVYCVPQHDIFRTKTGRQIAFKTDRAKRRKWLPLQKSNLTNVPRLATIEA